MAINIADLFEHAADRFPARVAVSCAGRSVTFAELDARADRLAHHLAAHGVGAGDHLGLYARNSIEAVETLIAAYKLRAVAINVNYRYVEEELRYLFADSDLVALVHDRRYTDKVLAVGPDLVTLAIGDETGPGDFDAAIDAAPPGRDFGPRSPDDPYILYTGGTTGHPKGVIWRHEDIWRVLGGGIDFLTGIPLEDEWAQARRGEETGGMVRLCLAPLIHGNAQWAALAAMFAGDTVVLVPRFDAHEIWRTIERERVNVIVLIGDAMARPLIEAYAEGGHDASSLWAISSSAALFSPTVKEQYLATLPGVVITDSIGSSETGFTGIGFVSHDAGRPEGPRVMPAPATIVLGEDGKRVAAGEVGRLARGGHVPLGYYKDPVKTAALFTEVDGERYTLPGDLARLEDDGTVTLLGRGNTCVNTGGEKVFPEEVEGALKSHPDVFDALVLGMPDPRLGQTVTALVQPRPDRKLDLAELDAHLRTRIAGYKVPRAVHLVDRIGRTPAGKADYRWARAYAEERS